MKHFWKQAIAMLAIVLAGLFALAGCSDIPDELVDDIADTIVEDVEDALAEMTETPAAQQTGQPAISEDKAYSSKDEVALYIHTYGHLPSNYITKSEAEAMGWKSSKGNLWDVAPGKSIGGDHFGNYQNKLPTAKGRKYKECDIDYDGSFRNAKRIIFSNDGLIFYTEDHYNTFEQLY